MLKTTYVRDGHGQIIGNITEGFASGDEVARDKDGHILGHSSQRFSNTRDSDGRLVSTNTADTGMLFRKK